MGIIAIFGGMGESFLVIIGILFYLFESYKYKSASEAPIIHFCRVISLLHFWFQQLQKLLRVGLKNLRILPLKTPTLSAVRIAGSSLFHSMIADRKQVFLKKLCLILIWGMHSTFLVA